MNKLFNKQRVQRLHPLSFLFLIISFMGVLSCTEKYVEELPEDVSSLNEKRTDPANSNNANATSQAEAAKAYGTTRPVNRSKEAQQLFDYLCSIYGKKILSGAMANVNWNINEAQWVYKHTGRWPAINCFDFIHHPFSWPGSWIDYSNTQVVEDWHNAGGIVAAMWHWNVLANNKKDYSFNYGYDSNQTTFDVRKIFDPQSAEYKQMIKDIDQIAGYLKKLKDKGIPVLWRPLHEAGGQWFWWGKDAAACCELWRIMYQRFEDAGLDNLIWMWTHAAAWMQPFSEGMKWYPGDEYVDIVGFDLYNVSNANECNTNYFQWLSNQCPDKLVAITECGNIASISSQWNAGAKWLFFMPWYDYGRTNNPNSDAFNDTSHGSANIDWWKSAWSCDEVLSRDQIDMIPLSIRVPSI